MLILISKDSHAICPSFMADRKRLQRGLKINNANSRASRFHINKIAGKERIKCPYIFPTSFSEITTAINKIFNNS
jgi:hypothetical protein